MSEFGKYPLPKELKNEDRWAKFFTLKQIVCLAAALVVSFGIVSLFMSIGLTWIGIVIAAIIMSVVGVLVMVKIPEHMYLYGSGKYVYTMLLVWFIRRGKNNRVIYTKNLNGPTRTRNGVQ